MAHVRTFPPESLPGGGPVSTGDYESFGPFPEVPPSDGALSCGCTYPCGRHCARGTVALYRGFPGRTPVPGHHPLCVPRWRKLGTLGGHEKSWSTVGATASLGSVQGRAVSVGHPPGCAIPVLSCTTDVAPAAQAWTRSGQRNPVTSPHPSPTHPPTTSHQQRTPPATHHATVHQAPHPYPPHTSPSSTSPHATHPSATHPYPQVPPSPKNPSAPHP